MLRRLGAHERGVRPLRVADPVAAVVAAVEREANARARGWGVEVFDLRIRPGGRIGRREATEGAP